MFIRHATENDIDAISKLEKLCFLATEAASYATMAQRVKTFPAHFWLCFEDDILVSYIGGICTDESTLTDEMFASPAMHSENGSNQMLFSVCTHPEHQGKGYASAVMERLIFDCRASKRNAIILTCKKTLLPFYRRFGFQNQGVSASEHGGAIWYQMELNL